MINIIVYDNDYSGIILANLFKKTKGADTRDSNVDVHEIHFEAPMGFLSHGLYKPSDLDRAPSTRSPRVRFQRAEGLNSLAYLLTLHIMHRIVGRSPLK